MIKYHKERELTVYELCEKISCSKDTVYKMIRKKQIKFTRSKNSFNIPWSQIEAAKVVLFRNKEKRKSNLRNIGNKFKKKNLENKVDKIIPKGISLIQISNRIDAIEDTMAGIENLLFSIREISIKNEISNTDSIKNIQNMLMEFFKEMGFNK